MINSGKCQLNRLATINFMAAKISKISVMRPCDSDRYARMRTDGKKENYYQNQAYMRFSSMEHPKIASILYVLYRAG